VNFVSTDSTFSSGVVIESAGGLRLSKSVTAAGISSLSAGTGTLTLDATMVLSTTGNALTLIADDLDLVGTAVSSGTAAMSIQTFSNRTIAVGATTAQMTIGTSELALITSGGLSVGGMTSRRVEVAQVTNTNSNGISGTVTLLAMNPAGQVLFSGGSTTFYSLSAQADDGVFVNANVFATSGGVSLDGDTNDGSVYPGNVTNNVVFSGARTISGKLTMTLESTVGRIEAQGPLTLVAGSGMVIHDDVHANSTVALNADSESTGTDGTFTVQSLKTLSAPYGSVDITTYDLDLSGSINGISTVMISATKTGQTMGFGSAAAKDMHVSDAELTRITSPRGLSFGSTLAGSVTINGITQAHSGTIGILKITAMNAGASAVFDTASCAFASGVELYAMAGVTLSGSVSSTSAPTILSGGTGTFTVKSGNSLSTTGQALTITADDIVIETGSSVSSGAAATVITTFCKGPGVTGGTCNQPIGVGSAVEPFHIADSELDSIVANGGLTIGSSGGGSISVSGVSVASTDQTGTVSLIATKVGNTVTFKTSASAFSQGIVVQAANGITLSESVATKAAPSSMSAGAGTLTIEGSIVLSTNGQNLVITADDINLAAASSVNAGAGAIELHGFSANRELGIGATVKPFHVSDAELGRCLTTSTMSIGDAITGSITVNGVTAGNTGSITALSLIATQGGKQVVFDTTSSAFSGGLHVSAAGGVQLKRSVTSNGASSISAGTGTLTLEASHALSTTGNTLVLVADDVNLLGTTVSSGAALISLKSFSSRTIGIGTDTEQMDVAKTEVAILQSGGLIVGGVTAAGIKVTDITKSDSNGVSGTVTLMALVDDAQVVFSGISSTFYGINAKGDDGVTINADMFITSGSVYLDGDADDSAAGDNTNNVMFTGARTVIGSSTMTLESSTGLINANNNLTLLAGSGMVIHDNLFGNSNTGSAISLNADYESAGDGTLSVTVTKMIKTFNGALMVTAFDIDLQYMYDSNGVFYTSSIDAGTAPIVVHGAGMDQSIGLGDSPQQMHISDQELLQIHTSGSITFRRFGTGAIVVESVSRKYSTKADSIIFQELYADVVSSKYRVAGAPQIERKSYATVADFAGPAQGLPRLVVPQAVATGAEITVTWYPDVYSERRSHKYDWVGLFRKGECSDEATTLSNRLHKCYLAWKYTTPNLLTGVSSFAWSTYKVAGEYEVRYFYGDSTDGQGYRCITLDGTSDTYKQCILSARQTSSVIHVGDTGTISSMSSVPGLVEKVCDGSKKLCE